MIKIQTKEVNPERLKNIVSKFNIDVKLAEFFVKREIDDRKIKLLLEKELELLPNNNIINIDIASNVIKDYINNPNAKIYIYADYDADGINSGFIAYDCISQLINIYDTGATVELKLPNREEGYGLSLDWCHRITKKNLKEKKDVLVITVDNGITKKVESDFLTANNIKVIITDHHNPKENETPDTDKCIVIDPHLYNEGYNAKGLCGAAIAYKLFSYLLDTVYEDTSGYSSLYLVNAAIATITDMMPHTEENLRIVSNGLRLLNNNYCVDSLSYYKDYKKKVIKPKDIAFELGPQLNACGRMGNIQLAIDYMLSSEEDDIIKTYKEMDKLNDSRKDKEKEIIKKVFKNDYSQHNIIIALIDDLGGLGGTVASKIVSRYNKPVIVINYNKDDIICHGSARNIGNIDLSYLFINEVNKGNLVNFGGHKAACGVTIAVDKLKDLQESLDEQLNELYTASGIISNDEDTSNKEEIIYVDDVIGLAEINKNTVKPYQDVLFFNNFKEPVYAIKEVEILSTRLSANPSNICFNMIDGSYGAVKDKYGKVVGKELWMWGFAEKYKEMGSPTIVHLIGKIEPDFRNERVLTFNIEDMIIA